MYVHGCVVCCGCGHIDLIPLLLLPLPSLAAPSLVRVTEERDPSGVVSLTCSVEPPGGLYNITWSVPDSVFIGGEGLTGSNITVIPGTSASGVYQCLASNEFGCAAGETTLLYKGTLWFTF